MEALFDFQTQIEGALILSAILLGGYFLFTDNFSFFEKKAVNEEGKDIQTQTDDRSINSVRSFGEYFKEFFAFFARIAFRMPVQTDSSNSLTQKSITTAIVSLLVLVLLTSISGKIGKSISTHWMDQGNGFHFGFKNLWSQSCSVKDVIKSVSTSGNQAVNKSKEIPRTLTFSDFVSGLTTEGTTIDDDQIKITSFDKVFTNFKKYGWYLVKDSILTKIKKKDTLLSLRISSLKFTDEPEKEKRYELYTKNEINEKTITSLKDSVLQTSIVYKSPFYIDTATKVTLYHLAKNYFYQNSGKFPDVTTNIKEKSNVINFSRTLALAFYIMFLLLFLNMLIIISRAFKGNRTIVFSFLILSITLLYIFKKFYLLNLFTFLTFIFGWVIYLAYLKKGKKLVGEELKHSRSYRLSILFSLTLTSFALLGYLVSSVNWKFREKDNDKYIFGNFKSVAISDENKPDFPRSIKLLIQASAMATFKDEPIEKKKK